MKKILLLALSTIVLFVFGQNRKKEFQLSENSSSHTLYVAFKDISNNTKDVATEVANRNTTFRNFVEQNKITFDNDLGISETKKREFSNNCLQHRRSDESVRKLNRIYKVHTSNHDNDSLLRLAAEFEKFDEVEYASLMSNEPVQPPIVTKFSYAATPNLESLQTYFFDNPGISADYAWSIGITGNGIKLRDVEYGLNKNHEMLINRSPIKIEPGYAVNSALVYPTGQNYSWLDHGTAVASILSSESDGVGVSGAVPNASEFISYLEWTTLGYNRQAAVARSINGSSAGDIIMYEMQTGGQNSNYVPAEYNNVIWDLTKAATDSGITIIAAAGNGGEDLDSAYYSSYRARGNSGAIIVGAGSNNTQHSILSFSTYGSRVNLQGWGTNVLAAGYGDYAMYDGDYNRTYTRFSGTSSATPIVTSAFALVQSFYFTHTGNYLSTPEMLTLLRDTGYPQSGANTSKNIGPFPNVKKAIEKLMTILAIKEEVKPFSITISPNPAQDIIHIKGSEKTELTFEIINMLGQVVLKDGLTKQNKYNISQLPKGNYIIKATDGKRIAIEKLIKQ